MVNTAGFQPRDGIALIPDGFEAHGAASLDGTHTADVELWTGPADGAPEWSYDPATKTETRNHGTLVTYAQARLQRLLSENEQPAGEQDVTTRRYLVVLPWDASWVTTRTHVKVLSGDPLLEGRWLSVLDAQGGSLRFERHLICLNNLETP